MTKIPLGIVALVKMDVCVLTILCVIFMWRMSSLFLQIRCNLLVFYHSLAVLVLSYLPPQTHTNRHRFSPLQNTVFLFFILIFPFPACYADSQICFLPHSDTLTYTQIHTQTHSSVCTSPGAPGKGRVKMEMNSAMLQVATQICICNYPQKYTRIFLSFFLLLMPSALPLFPISSFSPRPDRFPFSSRVSELPPSPPPCLSHPLSVSKTS